MEKLPQKIKFVEFPEIKEKLQQLADDYKSLVVNDETFTEAKKARKTLRDERYAIQKIEKSNTSILNDIKRKNKDLAAELISVILPVEEKIDTGIKAIEAAKAEEKRKREEEKAKQMEEWGSRAQSILTYLDKLIGLENAEDVRTMKLIVEKIEISEANYGSFILIADANKKRVLKKCEDVLVRMKEKEKEEKARQKALAEEKKKALEAARKEYEEYFGIPASDDLTASKIKAEIKKDTEAKLEKLRKLEEEKKVIPTETPVVKKEVVNYDDQKAFKEWRERLTDVYRTAPSVSDKRIQNKIDNALPILENVLKTLNS